MLVPYSLEKKERIIFLIYLARFFRFQIKKREGQKQIEMINLLKTGSKLDFVLEFIYFKISGLKRLRCLV